MTEREAKLVSVAKQYDSVEDFKKYNLPKYLLCRKARLLDICFMQDREVPKLKGLYYLLYKHIIVYIGYSLTDLQAEIDSHKETNKTYTGYRYWTPHSDSDTVVLYHYLCQKHRPKYNTNILKDSLTIAIEEASSVRGKSIEVTL